MGQQNQAHLSSVANQMSRNEQNVPKPICLITFPDWVQQADITCKISCATVYKCEKDIYRNTLHRFGSTIFIANFFPTSQIRWCSTGWEWCFWPRVSYSAWKSYSPNPAIFRFVSNRVWFKACRSKVRRTF